MAPEQLEMSVAGGEADGLLGREGAQVPLACQRRLPFVAGVLTVGLLAAIALMHADGRLAGPHLRGWNPGNTGPISDFSSVPQIQGNGGATRHGKAPTRALLAAAVGTSSIAVCWLAIGLKIGACCTAFCGCISNVWTSCSLCHTAIWSAIGNCGGACCGTLGACLSSCPACGGCLASIWFSIGTLCGNCFAGIGSCALQIWAAIGGCAASISAAIGNVASTCCSSSASCLGALCPCGSGNPVPCCDAVHSCGLQISDAIRSVTSCNCCASCGTCVGRLCGFS